MSRFQLRTPSKSEIKIVCFLLNLEPDEYATLYLIKKQSEASPSSAHGVLNRLENSGFLESVEAMKGNQRIRPVSLTNEGKRFSKQRIKRYEEEKGQIPEDWTRFFLGNRSTLYKHDDLMAVKHSDDDSTQEKDAA